MHAGRLAAKQLYMQCIRFLKQMKQKLVPNIYVQLFQYTSTTATLFPQGLVEENYDHKKEQPKVQGDLTAMAAYTLGLILLLDKSKSSEKL